MLVGFVGLVWMGYEISDFELGGGIIDLLNKRLRDRLKEAEILNIFTDVCEVSLPARISREQDAD